MWQVQQRAPIYRHVGSHIRLDRSCHEAVCSDVSVIRVSDSARLRFPWTPPESSNLRRGSTPRCAVFGLTFGNVKEVWRCWTCGWGANRVTGEARKIELSAVQIYKKREYKNKIARRHRGKSQSDTDRPDDGRWKGIDKFEALRKSQPWRLMITCS